MVTVNKWVIFIINKFFVDFRHFRVFAFSHRAFSKTRKPRKIFIYQGIKIIYLILSTFPSNLCVQDTILKVLLKVINENLPVRLESSFGCYSTAKMVLK